MPSPTPLSFNGVLVMRRLSLSWCPFLPVIRVKISPGRWIPGSPMGSWLVSTLGGTVGTTLTPPVLPHLGE